MMLWKMNCLREWQWHSEIYREVCVNVSSLYTFWKFQKVLTDKSLDCILPVPHSSLLLETSSLCKKSVTSSRTQGLTHCLVNLNLSTGTPPRPNKIQRTLAAVTVFDEQLNSFWRVT